METIKVVMLVSIAADNWSFVPGQVIELDTDLAGAWIECGHAGNIKGEEVDKTPLEEGIDYLGFGQYLVHGGQFVNGKAAANETHKFLLAKVGEENAEGTGTADNGADNAGNGEVAPKG